MTAANQELPIGSSIPELKDDVANPHIIFKEIDIVADPATNELNIVYLPSAALPPGSIDQVVDALVTRQTVRMVPPFSDRTSPLDLNCNREAYVIFKLASDWNWHFSPDGVTFTTKADERGRYFNLINVTYDSATGVIARYRGGEPIEGECRLLYFRARGTTMGYCDGFNLIAELDLGTAGIPPVKRRTKLVIDPDIRHPGGSV
jgi:hypothetical protein